jgi:WD40 repeat protein
VMPKRGRDDGAAAGQRDGAAAAATDEYGREVAVDAQPSPSPAESQSAADAAAAEWHVDYRKPLRRWASQVLPRCGNARSCAEDDNFVKGVKWSPDGRLLLSNSEDHSLRVWALDEAALPDAWSTSTAADDSVLRLSTSRTEAECVYDFCWYPGARATELASCCALSCSRDTPLHLWDACPSESGVAGRARVRATYRPYDHNDEVAAAMSCCFSPDGEQIYCGFEHAVHVFQTARPGRDSIMRKTTPTRKARQGLKGLVSTLAVTPDGSVYAAGSYSASVGLYSCAQGETVALLPASSGVSQVSFAPDGLLLMVGERKSSALTGWCELTLF